MENPERLTPAERRELVKGNRRVGFAVRGREAVEGAHADLSGPAVRRILPREYAVCGQVSIAERRKPDPPGRPGLHHSNAVDTVPQWPVVGGAEFTKSRACRTTDNALVEGNNGAAARRHIGYGAIGAEHAEAFQKFYTACCNPCLHYHRPCGLATVKILARGKRKRSCPVEDYRPP